MNLNISYNWLFHDVFTLIIVLIFLLLLLSLLIVAYFIIIASSRRSKKIKNIAEKNGLIFEAFAKSDEISTRLLGEVSKAEIENYCKGNYRGHKIEFYDLIYRYFEGIGPLGKIYETLIKIDDAIIHPIGGLNGIRDISKSLTKPEDILIIIDNHIDNK